MVPRAGSIPVNYRFVSATVTLYIIPAACQAGGFRRFYYLIVMTQAIISIGNRFVPATGAFHIIPAACPAAGYCSISDYIVMPEATAPAKGDWLPVSVQLDSVAA